MAIPIKQVIVKDKKGYYIDLEKIRGEMCDCDQKTWKAMIAEAFEQAGIFWHENMLPRKFEPNAKYRYKYQQRNRKYNERKEKKFGQAIDLIYTGDMMRKVTRVLDVKTNSSKAEVKITLHGPTHLYAYRKDYNQPDKAAELKTVLKMELQELADVIEKSLVKQYENIGKGIKPK